MINVTSSATPARTVLRRQSRRSADAVRREPSPAFGFILVGGALTGAQVRDVRLANELVRRGYPVHVWWAFDWPRDGRLDPAIEQRWLFSSPRYSGVLAN